MKRKIKQIGVDVLCIGIGCVSAFFIFEYIVRPRQLAQAPKNPPISVETFPITPSSTPVVDTSLAAVSQEPPPVQSAQQSAKRVEPDIIPRTDVQFPTLSFKGTFIVGDTHERQALINDTIVRVGDRIHGVTVKTIALHYVELEKDGKTATLLME